MRVPVHSTIQRPGFQISLSAVAMLLPPNDSRPLPPPGQCFVRYLPAHSYDVRLIMISEPESESMLFFA